MRTVSKRGDHEVSSFFNFKTQKLRLINYISLNY